AFGVLALGMVGVPPAVGFVGKWYVALGAVEASAWPLAVVILASTLLTLAYFARILERMFFRDSEEPRSSGSSEEPRSSESGDTADTPSATDGGADLSRPSIGMTATVVVAAFAAIALGMLAFEYGQLLEPTVQALLS
ncbi:monovalent cation/H+ antiporter subunit D family protein, partial [Halolamina salina]